MNLKRKIYRSLIEFVPNVRVLIMMTGATENKVNQSVTRRTLTSLQARRVKSSDKNIIFYFLPN